jgi:AcrR family transcriptional regulator
MRDMTTPDLSQRIIAAALDQFGRLGFDAASTRDIARASGTAMSSITYHFGGKQGLYLACADRIAVAIGGVHAPLMEALKANPPTTAEAARAGALALLENFARFMLAPESETYCQFIVREQQHPTEAFERIYAHMMSPVLEAATALVAIARPSLDERARRALVTNLMGMAIVLRVARACVARVMQVDDLDRDTSDYLIATLRRSAQTLLMED